MVALLCSAALLAAPGARADDAKKGAPAASKSEDASQRFRSGVSFYKAKDFAAAMVEFKKAYELAPNYVVLFNIGQTSRELNDYAGALKAFQQYLADGGAKVSAARRKEAQAAIDELVNKVGKLEITLNVAGAEVTVDDVLVGKSPLADGVMVNVGRRKLSATSSGYVPVQRVVDVAGGGETAVSLELVKIELTPPVALPPPPPPSHGIPIVTVVAASATGASLVVTGILGGLAVSAHKSLESDLATFPGNPSAIASDQSRTRTLANATDALIGITAAGAVATTVLFVLPKVSDAWKPSATVGLSPAGVVVRGSF